MQKEPDASDRTERLRKAALVAAGVCFVLGIIPIFIGVRDLGKAGWDNLANLGNLGSFLQGTTASLWALSGVCLIFAAFVAQMIQLRLQREDLDSQKEQQERQNALAQRLSFESSFFELLNLQNQIAASMRDNLYSEHYEGRTCFKFWYRTLRDGFEPYHNPKGWAELPELQKIAQVYGRFYSEQSHQAELAHYFRTLYHLVKFVKQSEVVTEYKDRRRYTSLARAQLSAFELALLFYNGLSPYGKGFKELIEEFGLLEHLDEKLIFDPRHLELYQPEAFK